MKRRAKVRVRKRGHKSGAPPLLETGGEKRAKVLVRERGHKSGAAVSSNSDMQIGVPAEYCTTQNASDIFQSSLYLDEPIGKIWNKVGAQKITTYVNEVVHKLQNLFQMKRIMRGEG